MTPVVIASNGRGLPVVPVEDRGIPAIIATNGRGFPIVIATVGVPMVISGYTP